MIVFYDQKNTIFIPPQDTKFIYPTTDGKIEIFCYSGGKYVIAEYNNRNHAQYVIAQIVSAISKNSSLYRMPSKEDVERELKYLD